MIQRDVRTSWWCFGRPELKIGQQASRTTERRGTEGCHGLFRASEMISMLTLASQQVRPANNSEALALHL
jgi:hypothetical protein